MIMIAFILFGLLLNIIFYFMESGTKREDLINKRERKLKQTHQTPLLSVQSVQ